MDDEIMNVDDMIERMKTFVSDFEKVLSVSIIEEAPFIVEVGALTVTTNDEGVVQVHNTPHPTQFTQKAVNTIKEITFRDGRNKVIKPIVYGRTQWYSKQLEGVKSVLNALESGKKN